MNFLSGNNNYAVNYGQPIAPFVKRKDKYNIHVVKSKIASEWYLIRVASSNYLFQDITCMVIGGLALQWLSYTAVLIFNQKEFLFFLLILMWLCLLWLLGFLKDNISFTMIYCIFGKFQQK